MSRSLSPRSLGLLAFAAMMMALPALPVPDYLITQLNYIGLFSLVALGLVLLTGVGVASVSWVLPKDIAALARIDLSLLALTLLVAVVATVLAGLYPTFRASRVQPAWQLKSN